MISRRPLRIALSRYDAALDQFREADGQEVSGDTEVNRDVIEAAQAEEQIPQDQRCPPFSDHVQTSG
jgi:hypothetical protein